MEETLTVKVELPRCEGCKYFEAKALGDVDALCHNEKLEQRDTGGYWSFMPPTYDGSDFGCVLWQGQP